MYTPIRLIVLEGKVIREQAYFARRWTLDTPAWAVRNRRFYEKLGYVKVAEHEHDDTPLIAYEKQLL